MAGVSVAPELGVLLAIAILGGAGFAVFEVETPWWRKALKWALMTAVTLAIWAAAGHWALIFPIAAGLLGVAFHVWWCRKNGIDPANATPRRKYYQLRGWAWRE